MTFFDYSLPSAGAVEEVMGGLVRPLSRAEMAAPLPLLVLDQSPTLLASAELQEKKLKNRETSSKNKQHAP